MIHGILQGGPLSLLLGRRGSLSQANLRRASKVEQNLKHSEIVNMIVDPVEAKDVLQVA